ncbi:DUF6359 domain-containing protein [Teredinibacter turnerae]|uniref:DUF6359 domain-containing protein n=1 Tax=Teredinibacter turnerae TaxID=2426 RepID=UPI00037CF68C|nr:DUF6359 domain-containing protein [Teredinibacter turnerae]
MLSNWRLYLLLSIFLGCAALVNAAPYEWNYPAPVLTPSAGSNNGKVVFFDVSHGGTEGNADWVIDGGFSDFANALKNVGYTVKEYRGVDKNNDGIIQFVDDYTSPSAGASAANEAIISYSAISAADVLVFAESNRPFTQAELTALEQFLTDGKGIFFIADHYNADRNLNTWDSTEVYNGYNRSNLAKYNVGGAYGDLRNPGSATAGWLASNFGIRFRFNAINWLSGASGIQPASQVEGLTTGVTPVLMAAGATLAITDPTRAKGLVYFSASDNPSAWNYAVDSGLYFGGTAEGPYVAIAKSGAGKAAFIGDSSPIEDSSTKYRREDSGGTKSTYPGWTDSGNAAQLSVNIVNWLATTESYTHFNSSAHPSGTATPNPMASEELTDPDNGQPWTNPSGSYDPWNPASFANGAYGAPYNIGGGTSSSSSSSSTSSSSSSGGTGIASVSAALAASTGTNLTVRGVITQAINGIYALEIADENNTSATIYVKLESQYRSEFSPQNNPSIVGETLQVSGRRDVYMSQPSIEYVTDIQIVAASGGALSVAEALAEPVSTPVTAVGVITQAINGIYALEMADESNSAATIYVKLESQYRADFSPQNDPTLIGKTLLVSGVRDNYQSQPSIEYVTAMELISDGGSTGNCGSASAVSVDTAYASSTGTDLTVVGEVVAGVNNPYALELADLNSSTTVYVKLESGQRAQFSPANNPAILGEVIEVVGKRDLYMSYPSLEYVSSLQILNNCN